MRIAVISDSHGRFPDGLFEAIAGARLILHLGDLGPGRMLDILESLAPVRAVQGNNDAPDPKRLPVERHFEELGLHFHLRHKPWSREESSRAPRPSLFLHGHSHRPRILAVETGYIACPGSLRLPRGGYPPSYGWVVLDEGLCRLSLWTLPDRVLIDEVSWNPTGGPQEPGGRLSP